MALACSLAAIIGMQLVGVVLTVASAVFNGSFTAFSKARAASLVHPFVFNLYLSFGVCLSSFRNVRSSPLGRLVGDVREHGIEFEGWIESSTWWKEPIHPSGNFPCDRTRRTRSLPLRNLYEHGISLRKTVAEKKGSTLSRTSNVLSSLEYVCFSRKRGAAIGRWSSWRCW